MFGDLKLLLGYRHAGYHTEVRRENPWWLQRAPTAIQPPQQANPNPPPQPPPQDRDQVLLGLARRHGRIRGQRRVNWMEVHHHFGIRYPDSWRSSKMQ
jgi:hypothetical protein